MSVEKSKARSENTGTKETRFGVKESSRVVMQGSPAANASTCADHFIRLLRGVVPRGDGWQALCPAHDDTNPSLSIDIGGDGRVLLKCHAGCCAEDICQAIGLKTSDLFPGAAKPVLGSAKQTLMETYSYTDANGKEIFQVLRYEPGKNGKTKDFKQRHRDPDGKTWIWNMKGVQRELYELPRVLDAIVRGETVYLVEGERKVHALEAFGLIGTCNRGGAGKWEAHYTATLKGADVYILPDNDQVGCEHAESVCRALRGKARSVRIVDLPDLPPKGDIIDWIRAGGTRERLLRLVGAAPEWVPAGNDLTGDNTESAGSTDAEPIIIPAALSHLDLVTGPIPPINWCIDSLIPEGAICILAGDTGVGKSWVLFHLAQAVAAGLPFLGHFEVKQGSVLYLDAESSENLLRRRFGKLWCGLTAELPGLSRDLPLQVIPSAVNLDGRGCDALEARIVRDGISMVLIDPLIHFSQADENDARAMAAFLERIRALTRATGCVVVIAHHTRKSSHFVSNTAIQMIRGSTAITGVTDCTLFLRRLDRGTLLVEHGKSRHADEVPNFIIQIADRDEQTTTVTYGGESAASAENRAELAEASINRTIADLGGHAKRPDILEQCRADGVAKKTAENALTAMVKSDRLTKRQDGRYVVYSLASLPGGEALELSGD